MKLDLRNIDEVVKRYWPPAANEEMQSDIDRVRRRLESGTARATATAVAQPSRWRMAMVAAASLLLLSVVGIVGWRYSRAFAAFAVVESEEGSLFRVVDGKAAPIHAHERLRSGETIRTNSGAGAQLLLADGSRVEMRATSELVLEHADDGVRIRLSTGGVIVNAAKQHGGHLYVQTKDVTVSVIGTVFFVNTAEEGSRVGVIEGEVRVQHGAANNKLLPGQQIETNPLMNPVSLQQAVAWSRHAESHAARLEQSATAPAPAPVRLEFEEISIRPAATPAAVPGGRGDAGGIGIMPPCPVPGLFQIQTDPGRFIVSNATLYTLVAFAYGKDCGFSQATGAISGGPGWMRSERFDIHATIPEGAFTSTPLVRDPKLQAMLQAMLKKRFQLALHPDMKTMDAYDLLLVDKGKLKVSKNQTPQGFPAPGTRICDLPPGPGWGAQAARMSSVANALSGFSGRPVIDKTGFEELIDVCLPLAMNSELRSPSGSPIQLPALFRTLEEQMGLKVQSSVAPVEILVIERAEPPSEN